MIRAGRATFTPDYIPLTKDIIRVMFEPFARHPPGDPRTADLQVPQCCQDVIRMMNLLPSAHCSANTDAVPAGHSTTRTEENQS